MTEQMDRIEAKLDVLTEQFARLLDALADQGEEEQGESCSITTMDGKTYVVPSGDGFL